MKLTKTTFLDGHYATGDWEAFVFDRHPGPVEHSAAYHAWRAAHSKPSEDPPDEVMDESCRTYPNDLIPEGADHRKGRWKITVEFEPLEEAES